MKRLHNCTYKIPAGSPFYWEFHLKCIEKMFDSI